MAFTPFTPDEHPTMENFNAKFRSAMNNVQPVGTVIQTVRTDLDDTWLPCDGRLVYADKNPDLVPLLKTKGVAKSASIMDGASKSSVSGFAYGNGYYVIAMTYSDASNTHCAIAYARNISGPWTVKDIWSSAVSEYTCTAKVRYLDGKFILCGSIHANGTVYARIAYAEAPSDNWSVKDLWSGRSAQTGVSYIVDICYVNSKFVACGQTKIVSTGYTYQYYGYTDSIDGEWSYVSGSSSSSYSSPQYLNCIYVDGTYYFLGRNISGSTNRYYIYSTTDLANKPSQVSVSGGYIGLRAIIMQFLNGGFVVGGDGRVYYAKTASGIDESTYVSVQLGYVHEVFYENGRYIFICANGIATADSLAEDAATTYSTLGELGVIGAGCIDGNGTPVVAAKLSSDPYSHNSGAFSSITPIISIDGVNAFIKAKE